MLWTRWILRFSQFSKDMGVLPEQVVPALYQSLSAGVPPDNVFSFLTTAEKTAIGGVTDLTTAVDGLSTVTNAYGQDVISAQQASDIMFTGVRLGKTTIDELSGSLGQVIPQAVASGVSFDQVTAALAALTVQGIDTNMAATDLRQMLVELSKSGQVAFTNFQAASGQTFPDFIASGHNVADALAVMNDYAQANGKSIGDMFGSVQAATAAMDLSGQHAQLFNTDIKQMGDSAGATQKAYDQMDQGIQRNMDKISANIAALKIQLGQELAPALAEITDWAVKDLPQAEKNISDLASVFKDLASGAKAVNDAMGGNGWEILHAALEDQPRQPHDDSARRLRPPRILSPRVVRIRRQAERSPPSRQPS